MTIIPKRALILEQSDTTEIDWVTPEDDSSGMWIGYAKKWRIRLDIVVQFNSGATPNFIYGTSNVAVGDWVATSASGVAVRISDIDEVIDDYTMYVIVDDVDLYNILNDSTFSGIGIGPDGTGALFPIDDVSKLPILGPVPSYIMDLNLQMDLFARFIQQGMLEGGGTDELGPRTDGTYTDGAVMDWDVVETHKDDVIGDLNYVLKRSLPKAYNDISEVGISFKRTVSSGTVANYYIANGIPNHTGNALDYTSRVHILPNRDMESYSDLLDTVGQTSGANLANVGPSHAGELSVLLNGTSVGTRALTWQSNIGQYGALQILEETEVPHRNIWKKARVAFNAQAADGLNKVELVSSISGSTEALVAVETITGNPTVDNITYTPNTNTTLFHYSSGIPHYHNGTGMIVNGRLANAIGRTYPELFMRSNGGLPHYELTQAGLKAHLNMDPDEPFQMNQTNINFTMRMLTPAVTDTSGISGAGYGPIVLETFNSVSGEGFDDHGVFVSPNTSAFVCKFDETVIMETPTVGAMNFGLKRQVTPAGATPVMPAFTWVQNFNGGSNNVQGDAAASHEAVILGGVIRHTQKNFSTQHYPVGPDYSGKAATQYITFKTQMTGNRLTLIVGGTHKGIWIKLPGIQNEMPNAVNGWMDGTKQADFAPTRWPGSIGASDGCLLNIQNESQYTFTFGGMSSAFATERMVLIRIALEAGDEIETLQIVEA